MLMRSYKNVSSTVLIVVVVAVVAAVSMMNVEFNSEVWASIRAEHTVRDWCCGGRALRGESGVVKGQLPWQQDHYGMVSTEKHEMKQWQKP